MRLPKIDHLRSAARDLLGKWLNKSGSCESGIEIYFYHGLVQKRQDKQLERNFHLLSDFREHVQFFRRHGVMALDDLTHPLAQRGGSDRRTAVITFDDGYANNLLAAEILAEAKLPWCLFVSTAAMGRQKAMWLVELSLLLLQGRCDRLEALGQAWQLRERKERENAYKAIRYRLKAMPANSCQEAMNEIRGQFPVSEMERLLEQFPAFQMLTWKELRRLAEAGVEIGSHGVDHEIHHSAQDPEVRRRELVESKKEIERQLGRLCRFFAFPNGDYCEHSAQELEAAGYELAFTTRLGFIRRDSNRFLLPRISPGGSVAKLKHQLSELC
jgi:peptidoglycan/xylan/chitin deacetylase (PgdA/CDA1 family)